MHLPPNHTPRPLNNHPTHPLPSPSPHTSKNPSTDPQLQKLTPSVPTNSVPLHNPRSPTGSKSRVITTASEHPETVFNKHVLPRQSRSTARPWNFGRRDSKCLCTGGAVCVVRWGGGGRWCSRAGMQKEGWSGIVSACNGGDRWVGEGGRLERRRAWGRERGRVERSCLFREIAEIVGVMLIGECDG